MVELKEVMKKLNDYGNAREKQIEKLLKQNEQLKTELMNEKNSNRILSTELAGIKSGIDKFVGNVGLEI
jgi:Mg2+/Co2+ transporter CorB|tara:strand:+ start:281 stop:487 length:207 start_codon:yes stop_codon:yes gene_type:complete